jgi:ABC-type molybdate transport system permease subunit
MVALGLDQVLLAMGAISAPGKLMHTPFSLVLGMTYTYLPFMILPLFGNLAKMDLRLLEAAADLGATPWTAFWKITVPLSKAGIIAGSMLVFIPCVGEFVIPELLGGPETLMIGRVLWDEFFSNNDWPMASSVAVVMVLLIIVPLAIFNKYQAEAQEQRNERHAWRQPPAPLVRPRLAGPGLRLPVRAHRGPGAVLVQRFAHPQRLARLHAQVVRGPRQRRRDALRPVAEPEDRAADGLRVRGAGHAGGVCTGQVQALHRAARCSRAWSMHRW